MSKGSTVPFSSIEMLFFPVDWDKQCRQIIQILLPSASPPRRGSILSNAVHWETRDLGDFDTGGGIFFSGGGTPRGVRYKKNWSYTKNISHPG